MKKLLLLLWISSLGAMEKELNKLTDYNLSLSIVDTISPEQQKEQEDRKLELEYLRYLKSLNIRLMAPYSCKPKHLYFPDLKEEEE